MEATARKRTRRRCGRTAMMVALVMDSGQSQAGTGNAIHTGQALAHLVCRTEWRLLMVGPRIVAVGWDWREVALQRRVNARGE
jgi:hypothetical protein